MPITDQSVEILDPRFALVSDGAGKLERLCTGAVWSEGPVWMHEDDSVLWSDIPNNRMLRWQAEEGTSAAPGLSSQASAPSRGSEVHAVTSVGAATVWRDNIEFTNGHAREADGSLLHCSHGQRAIIRTRFDTGLATPLDEIVVDRWQGKRLNSPNDIIVKSDGSIWFSDPPYGIASDREGHKADSEIGDCLVFRFDPKTKELEAVTDWVEEPNGLAFSPDESLLYVSDTSAAMRTDGGGNHHIAVFDVIGGKQLRNPRVFAEVSPGLPDGFRIDRHGFVYTSSEDSVQVYAPDGTRIGRIAVPEKVGNLTFGGPDRDQLFIVASTSLYRIRLNTKGLQTP